ncbi:hypothetical protein HanRHA438_Chr01g0024831 [Helianthus annuus]|nr:hypothetical protein HanRHA438_Chr01g0024831 [Helianthus annuus]
MCFLSGLCCPKFKNIDVYLSYKLHQLYYFTCTLYMSKLYGSQSQFDLVTIFSWEFHRTHGMHYNLETIINTNT